MRNRDENRGNIGVWHSGVQESKQSLERLRRMATFEGQDFDTVDNDIERRVNLERDHLDYIAEDSWRWAIACTAPSQSFFSPFSPLFWAPFEGRAFIEATP